MIKRTLLFFKLNRLLKELKKDWYSSSIFIYDKWTGDTWGSWCLLFAGDIIFYNEKLVILLSSKMHHLDIGEFKFSSEAYASLKNKISSDVLESI